MLRKLRSATMATRLYISFSVIIALFIVVAVYSNAVINTVNVTHQHMADFVVPRSAEVDLFETVFTQFDLTVQTLILYHEFGIEMYEGILAHNSEIISEFVREMQAITDRYIALVNSDIYISEQNRLIGIGTMSALQMNVQQLYRAVSDGFFFGDTPSMQNLIDIGIHTSVVEENISRLRPYIHAEAGDMQAEIREILQNYSTTAFFVVIFVVLLSMLLAWLAVRSFVSRIKFIKECVLRIKQGDLSEIVESSDEISRLVNDILASMTEVISSINQVAIENENGNIDARIDVTNFEGGYREAMIRVNSLIDSIEKNHAASMRTALAEQNSLAKTRFLARMSHEIRTPITAVLGISEVQLRDPHLPLPVMEAFAKIFDSANILHKIINDILDISKIEANKMELVVCRYESSSLIADTVQLHVVNLGSKKINFEINIDENMPVYLVGDDLRIKQVINNILSNAFKYTDSGSVKLNLYCEHIKGKEVLFVIEVTDTGKGMSSAQIALLTDEYTRFHEQEDRMSTGTGLGMSITQGFINMMNGSLSVQSEVNVGTTFRVAIPQTVSGKDVIGKEAAKNLSNYEIGTLIGKRNMALTYESMPYGSVLIVDDDDTNLYVAQELMSFYNLQIETATGGYPVIEKIKSGKTYDIIFMDHMMPDINGVEAVRIIRNFGYKGSIVAFTANAMIGQAEEFTKNGFDSFLSKPIQTLQLDTILHKFIRNKQPGKVFEVADNISKVNEFLPNLELLDTVQKKFLSNHSDVMHKLEDALKADDLKLAIRLVHTLKGLVLLMGFENIGVLAEQLESSFTEGKVPEDLLSQLDAEVSALLSELEAKHGSEAGNGDALNA